MVFLPPCRFDSLYTTSNPPENVNLCFLWIPGGTKVLRLRESKNINFFLVAVTVATGKVERRSRTTLQAAMIGVHVLENWTTRK
jgi:hypothetical protein